MIIVSSWSQYSSEARVGSIIYPLLNFIISIHTVYPVCIANPTTNLTTLLCSPQWCNSWDETVDHRGEVCKICQLQLYGLYNKRRSRNVRISVALQITGSPMMVDSLTEEELEAVTVVFHQYETGLREGTILTRVQWYTRSLSRGFSAIVKSLQTFVWSSSPH